MDVATEMGQTGTKMQKNRCECCQQLMTHVKGHIWKTAAQLAKPVG